MIIAISYGIIIYIAFLYRGPLLAWLNQSTLTELPLMFFLAVLLGTIPVVPFTVFAGMMGMKYGLWIGSAINWTGAVGAAVVFFIVTRFFFIHQFQRYINRFDKVKKFDSMISRNAFTAVLFSRMLPIIPPTFINIYSGLSTMLFSTYFAATAIGQIPGMIAFAYLGNQLFSSLHAFVTGLSIYVGFLIIIILIYRWWY